MRDALGFGLLPTPLACIQPPVMAIVPEHPAGIQVNTFAIGVAGLAHISRAHMRSDFHKLPPFVG
jgi:hypothetical protein